MRGMKKKEDSRRCRNEELGRKTLKKKTFMK
jgi:hypothetical protein